MKRICAPIHVVHRRSRSLCGSCVRCCNHVKETKIQSWIQFHFVSGSNGSAKEFFIGVFCCWVATKMRFAHSKPPQPLHLQLPCWCPAVVLWLSCGCPVVVLWLSCGCPVVVLHLSYTCPTLVLWWSLPVVLGILPPPSE